MEQEKQPEVSQVTEKTLKPIKVHSEKQLAWSRELGKRSPEFKRAKKQRDEILEESVIENHVEVPEVLEESEAAENRDQPCYWLIVGIVALIIGGGAYFYKFKLRAKPKISQPKMVQPKYLMWNKKSTKKIRSLYGGGRVTISTVINAREGMLVGSRYG
jgi:hypothetical protein